MYIYVYVTEWFQGYGGKNQHPMYRTSNSNYGARAPSVHTMPTQFHAKSQKFSMVCIPLSHFFIFILFIYLYLAQFTSRLLMNTMCVLYVCLRVCCVCMCRNECTCGNRIILQGSSY